MQTRGDRIIENACPIQDEFPGYADYPPSRSTWRPEDVESACIEAASMQLFGSPLRTDYETTIAAAIAYPHEATKSRGSHEQGFNDEVFLSWFS
jgi:hypothetical protein